MIKVEVWRNPRGEIAAFRVKGHAGYAERGQDIVCAGVSTLSQSALLGLKRFLSSDYTLKLEDGLLQVSIPDSLNQDDRNNANVILETMLLGIHQIAENYPRNIKIVTSKL